AMVEHLESLGIHVPPVGVDLTYRMTRALEQARSGQQEVNVWRRGKREQWQINDRDLYNALTDSNAQLKDIPMGKLFKAAASIMRAGATLNPMFILRNLYRDMISAAINSQHGFKPVLDNAIGLWQAMTKGKYSQRWRAAAG